MTRWEGTTVVTGGTGLLGSAIVRQLAAEEAEEVVSVSSRWPTERPPSRAVKYVVSSLGQERLGLAVREALGTASRVIHLIGEERPGRPSAAYEQSNVEATRNILRHTPSSTFVLVASSSAIYGSLDAANPPSKEFDDPRPIDDFATSMLRVEGLVNARWRSGGSAGLARLFTVIGTDPNGESMLAKLASAAVTGRAATISPPFDYWRDFVPVKEAVCALMFVAEKEYAGPFNVATGESISYRELCRLVRAESGSSFRVKSASDARDPVVISRADISELTHAGFTPSTGVLHAVRDALDAARTVSRTAEQS